MIRNVDDPKRLRQNGDVVAHVGGRRKPAAGDDHQRNIGSFMTDEARDAESILGDVHVHIDQR